MRSTWILRGKHWRAFHLLRCDSCFKRFADDTPGAITATSKTEDEAERCLDFRGMSRMTLCPAHAAPCWKEAVAIAIYRGNWH